MDKPVPPPPPVMNLMGYRALVELEMFDRTIELPELSSPFDHTRGKVVLLGNGRVDFSAVGALGDSRYLSFDFAVGDRVLLSEYAVTPYHHAGWEYRIVSASDVVAVLPKKNGEAEP